MEFEERRGGEREREREKAGGEREGVVFLFVNAATYKCVISSTTC